MRRGLALNSRVPRFLRDLPKGPSGNGEKAYEEAGGASAGAPHEGARACNAFTRSVRRAREGVRGKQRLRFLLVFGPHGRPWHRCDGTREDDALREQGGSLPL